MINTTPQVLYPGKFSRSDIEALKSQSDMVIDIYKQQLEELYELSYPMPDKGLSLEAFMTEKGTDDLSGVWVYYPWNKQLIHTVEPDDLFALRTNRNKLLINEKEQQRLRDSVVGITGMSVGAGIALALSYSGISQHIKLADFDTLDTSNLNRLRESLTAIGQPKVQLAAQHIYELDPYASVDIFPKGIDETNIEKFFTKPALDIVIDEIDDFKMKVQLRVFAKKRRVPLLMFTSLGDNILVDVERYDVDENLQIFNGLLGDLTDEIIATPDITPDDARRYAVQLVGAEYVPTRALASLVEMGKTLAGRPQLYSTIAVDGGLCAFLVRSILLGEDIKSGRYFIEFSKLFDLENSDLLTSDQRSELLNLIAAKRSGN